MPNGINGTNRYVIDLAKLANEIVMILKLRYLPTDYFISQLISGTKVNITYTFTKDLEEVLLLTFRIQIEGRLNKLIGGSNIGSRYSLNTFSNFSKKYNLDEITIKRFIEGMSGYVTITDLIDSVIEPDSFNVWIISKLLAQYVLESIGDYRILEWEKDHIVDGRYVPSK